MSDWKRVALLFSSHDFPGARRLLESILSRTQNPETVHEMLLSAASGTFAPRGRFSQRDIDMAFLVKSLGGPMLLYAMQKGAGFASTSTVQREANVPQVLASCGIPSTAEVHTNISEQLSSSVRPPCARPSTWCALPGNTLMFDDVSVDPKARYCKQRDRMLGFCREHVHTIETRVMSKAVIDAARTALWETKTVHFATNATVVALGSFINYEHYEPVPLVLSGTDNSETAETLQAWIVMTLDVYDKHPSGATLHGPIWVLASDGASLYRKAKYLICSKADLINVGPQLFEILSELPGLNLSCSETGIVGGCDPKHVFKRFGTLLRNEKGFRCGRSTLMAASILKHLASLPGISLDEARMLFDPTDKQNVPKAVKLVETLKSLEYDTSLLTGVANEREAIVFLSKTLVYFVEPFIRPKWSLSDQLLSLATFSHLAFGLWRMHGSQCFTGALYADTQAVVKSIFFTTGRMQLIDGDLRFYIILEGTDRLEGLFGHVRGLNHDRNFDLLSLSERLAIAAGIAAALLRNPDLDRGHRRMDLSDVSGLDHVNIESWIGNVQVKFANLKVIWAKARSIAERLLRNFFGMDSISIMAWLKEHDVDMSCPNGEVVGTSITKDDARTEEERSTPVEAVTAVPESMQAISERDLVEIIPPSSELQAYSDEDDMSEHDRLAACEQAENVEDHNSNLQEQPLVLLSSSSVASDTAAYVMDWAAPGTSLTITIDGKNYYKSTLVPTLTEKGSRRVTQRTLRSQGLTLRKMQGHSRFEDMSKLTNADTIRAKDPVAALALSGSCPILVVLEIVSFHVGSHSAKPLYEISIEEFYEKLENIQITVQILELSRISTENGGYWTWTRGYICTDSTITDGRITRANYTLQLAASLVRPLALSMHT
jgi:hypothetical protein